MHHTHHPGPADVAVLVDWENLKKAAEEQLGTRPDPQRVLAIAARLGRVVLARAYADWLMPSYAADARALQAAGIDPVWLPGGVKNGADIRLAVDAVDLVHTRPTLGRVLIVSGDGGLTHAVHYLRQQGRYVAVLGIDGSRSALLARAADEARVYEAADPDIGLQPIIRSGSSTPLRERAFAALPYAISSAPNRTIPAVQATLETCIGAGVKSLGYPSVRAFFEDAAQRGIARLDPDPASGFVVRFPDEPVDVTALGEPLHLRARLLERLSEAELHRVVRLMAAAEERVGGAAHIGSLTKLVHSELNRDAEPPYSKTGVNRLVTEELVERGVVERSSYVAPGGERLMSIYRLARTPEVAEILATGTEPLPQEIDILPALGDASLSAA